jgi:PAS domain S-box-containing protein
MQIMASILDSLTSGVVAIDLEGTVIVFNEAAAKLLGIPKEDALGKPLRQTIPTSGLVNVVETRKPEIGTPQVIGERTVLANRSPIMKDGQMIGAVSVFQDITEMQSIARELDSTKTLVRTLEEVLAGAGEWMVVVDANGIVTMISEEYAEFNGTTVTEALGKHVTEVIENTRMHIFAQTGVAEMGET